MKAIANLHDWMEEKTAVDVSQSRSSQSLLAQIPQIRTWRSYLTLHKWLGKNTSPRYYGKALVKKAVDLSKRHITPGEFSQIASESLLLLIDELTYMEDLVRKDHLELLVASYISMLSVSGMRCCFPLCLCPHS